MSPHEANSGFGAECEQLDEGAEEGVQPALVGHALLHHFLLARILGRLLNGVGLRTQTQAALSQTQSFRHAKNTGILKNNWNLDA